MRTRRSFVPHLEQLETRLVLSRMALLPVQPPQETTDTEDTETEDPTPDSSPSQRSPKVPADETHPREPSETERPNESTESPRQIRRTTRTEEPKPSRVPSEPIVQTPTEPEPTPTRNDPLDRSSTEPEPTPSEDDQTDRTSTQTTRTMDTETNSADVDEGEPSSEPTTNSHPRTTVTPSRDSGSDGNVQSTEPIASNDSNSRTTETSSRDFNSEPNDQITPSDGSAHSNPRTTVISSREIDSDPNEEPTEPDATPNTRHRTAASPSSPTETRTNDDPVDTPRTSDDPSNPSDEDQSTDVGRSDDSVISPTERETTNATTPETEPDDTTQSSDSPRTHEAGQRNFGLSEDTNTASDTKTRTETISALDYLFTPNTESGALLENPSTAQERVIPKAAPLPLPARHDIPLGSIDSLETSTATHDSHPLVSPETLAVGILVLNAPNLFRRLTMISTSDEFWGNPQHRMPGYSSSANLQKRRTGKFRPKRSRRLPAETVFADQSLMMLLDMESPTEDQSRDSSFIDQGWFWSKVTAVFGAAAAVGRTVYRFLTQRVHPLTPATPRYTGPTLWQDNISG